MLFTEVLSHGQFIKQNLHVLISFKQNLSIHVALNCYSQRISF